MAQRTGTTINTIFTRGVGRLGNNYWEITNGQNGMAKLAEETGGQSFYLGTQNPVSFKPYLDDLQKGFRQQVRAGVPGHTRQEVGASVCEAEHRSRGCGAGFSR